MHTICEGNAKDCQIVAILMDMRLTGEQQTADRVSETLRLLLDHGTVHLRMSGLAAATLINEAQDKAEPDTEFQWPIGQPTYLEYNHPVPLVGSPDEEPAVIFGLIVVTGADHTKFMTLGSSGQNITLLEHRLDRGMSISQIKPTEWVGGEAESDELQRAARYYGGLAALIRERRAEPAEQNTNDREIRWQQQQQS